MNAEIFYRVASRLPFLYNELEGKLDSTKYLQQAFEDRSDEVHPEDYGLDTFYGLFHCILSHAYPIIMVDEEKQPILAENGEKIYLHTEMGFADNKALQLWAMEQVIRMEYALTGGLLW